MSNLDNRDKHLLVLGAPTVIVPFLGVTGYWDIFDLLISIVILGVILSYVSDNYDQFEGKYILLAGATISLMGTALLISIVAVFAGIFNSDIAAQVAIENFKAQQITPDPEVDYFFRQSLWQFSLFLISAFTVFKYLSRLKDKSNSKIENIFFYNSTKGYQESLCQDTCAKSNHKKYLE